MTADGTLHAVGSANMRVAIVHEWLNEWGGAESVLETMLSCLPGAELYAMFEHLSEDNRHRLGQRQIHTTFLQRAPGIRARFWNYLPLMPLAVEQLDLRNHDLVVSSSHAFAKGILTHAEQLHISYVHSPMRYAWDLYHDYLEDYGLTSGPRAWIARLIFHRLRAWDMRTHHGVDCFIANSRLVARRIWKIYRRRAIVIYPPVDIGRFSVQPRKESFYLVVSRLVSYKKVALIVEAFSRMPEKRLVVIGDGPEMQAIRSIAASNVSLLGYQPDALVVEHMQNARALVFAALEDFGITPVEAQACGTPVIAYGRGGARETVKGLGEDQRPTGLLFPDQTVASICEAIARFEAGGSAIDPEHCRENAEHFGCDRFKVDFLNLVNSCVDEWRQSGRIDEDQFR